MLVRMLRIPYAHVRNDIGHQSMTGTLPHEMASHEQAPNLTSQKLRKTRKYANTKNRTTEHSTT